MSSEESDGSRGKRDEVGKGAGEENDSLASKLSKELSNWKRRRTTARARRPDGTGGSSAKSEPARTIKVRGHETLVIRKPKLAKPPDNPDAGDG